MYETYEVGDYVYRVGTIVSGYIIGGYVTRRNKLGYVIELDGEGIIAIWQPHEIRKCRCLEEAVT